MDGCGLPLQFGHFYGPIIRGLVISVFLNGGVRFFDYSKEDLLKILSESPLVKTCLPSFFIERKCLSRWLIQHKEAIIPGNGWPYSLDG